MSRLVVVSNRVALPGENRAGGLAVALQDALEDQATEQRGGLWFGWSGKIDPVRSGMLHEQTEGGIDYVTIDLSRRDHADYYNGFANRSLWPLLHFRMDLVDYSRETYAAYRRVNALFAEKLAPRLRDGDLVWVHDYHLIPLASLLRERGVRCKLGFFLHVPMPSSDLLAALPQHGRLFEGLSAYDLVGFQTQRDLERFQDYVRLFGRGNVVAPGLLETAGGRLLRAGAFPISIDTGRIARQAADAVDKASVKRLRESLSGRRAGDRRLTGWTIPRACRSGSAHSSVTSSAIPTSWASSPSCRSRRSRARTSPSTASCGRSWNSLQATSMARTPSRTGPRCATSTATTPIPP